MSTHSNAKKHNYVQNRPSISLKRHSTTPPGATRATDIHIIALPSTTVRTKHK